MDMRIVVLKVEDIKKAIVYAILFWIIVRES